MKKNINLLCYISFCIVFIIFNILFLFNKIPHSMTFNFSRMVKYMVFGIVNLVEILFCILVYIMFKKNISLEKIFLAISIPLGLMFLVLIPIGQVPDEPSHFARVYEISLGCFMASEDGRNMPIEIADDLIMEQNSGNYSDVLHKIITKNSGKLIHYSFINTAVYNFVCYIPQTIGVLVGRILNLPILLSAYFGRLTNFICWIILVYLSVKYIPFAKKTLILISLLPMTLQEAVSLSPDSLTYSACLFLISYTLYLAYQKMSITKKDYAILSILCVVVSLCKIVYMPICLILFTLPKEKFKSKKDKYIKICSLAFVVIILNLIWLKIASGFLVETHPGVNPNLQKSWILSHPFSYLKVIMNSFFYNCEFYLYSMLGQSLELLSVNVSKYYPTLSLIGIVGLTILDRFTMAFIKIKDRVILVCILVSVLILIFTSLYIQWTPLKNLIVNGVQGRYFLPILLFVPLVFFKSKKGKYNYCFDNLNVYVLIYCIFSNLCALMYIFAVNL